MAASIRAIRGVLLHAWDPIGISDIPEAADEYDAYVLPIYRLLREHGSEDSLLDYLHWMTSHIGLPALRSSLRFVAAKLLQIDLSNDENFR